MGESTSIGRYLCVVFVLLLGIGMLSGCRTGDRPEPGNDAGVSTATLSGHVTSPDPLKFPQGASVWVRLIELGEGGPGLPISGILVAERRILAPGNPPVFFVLSYDRDKLSSLKSYALEASVVRGEATLWASMTRTALETGKLKSGGYRGGDAEVVLARRQ